MEWLFLAGMTLIAAVLAFGAFADKAIDVEALNRDPWGGMT